LRFKEITAQIVLDYLPKCSNLAFVKVIVLKEKKMFRKIVIRIAYNVTISRAKCFYKHMKNTESSSVMPSSFRFRASNYA